MLRIAITQFDDKGRVLQSATALVEYSQREIEHLVGTLWLSDAVMIEVTISREMKPILYVRELPKPAPAARSVQ